MKIVMYQIALFVLATSPEWVRNSSSFLKENYQEVSFVNKRWARVSTVITPPLDLDMDGKPDTDMTILLEDCEKDDTEMYRADGKVITYAGAEKCDEEKNETETGTWKYDARTKLLTVVKYDTRKPQQIRVEESTAGRLVVSSVLVNAKGKFTMRAVYRVAR